MDVHEMRKKKSLKSYLEMKACSKWDYVGINVKVGKKKKVWKINEQGKNEINKISEKTCFKRETN